MLDCHQEKSQRHAVRRLRSSKGMRCCFMAGALVVLGACMTWQLAGAMEDVADKAFVPAAEGNRRPAPAESGAAAAAGRLGVDRWLVFAAVSGVGVAWAGLPWAADAATSPSSSSMPPAPSGVNTLPEFQQAAIFFAIFAALAVLTRLVIGPGFTALRQLLPDGWFNGWQKTWPIVGGAYLAAGIAHFTAADAFESIYPPLGTWGFWYLPGSAAFHVAWTGVAEIAGGAGLLLGALIVGIAQLSGNTPPSLARSLFAASALGLFALTWAVTPANIYMYTHGAQMVGLTPGDAPIPVTFHAVRGALQVVLLSILWGCYEDASKSPEAEAR